MKDVLILLLTFALFSCKSNRFDYSTAYRFGTSKHSTTIEEENSEKPGMGMEASLETNPVLEIEPSSPVMLSDKLAKSQPAQEISKSENRKEKRMAMKLRRQERREKMKEFRKKIIQGLKSEGEGEAKSNAGQALGIAGLILSVVGLALSIFVTPLVSIVGLVLGAISFGQAYTHNGEIRWGIAAMVVAAIGLGIWMAIVL